MGIEGLAALLTRHASLPARETADGLAADLLSGWEARDDLTLVVVTRDS